MNTHALLVARAVRWLRASRGCSRVLAEFVTAWPEQPDAIGWRGPDSVLVEVKISRSDFRADAHKPRLPGLGRHRWYFTPSGLLRPGEIPEGWGLAEVTPGGVVRTLVEAPRRDACDTRGEVALLLSACRRHEIGVPWDAKAGRFSTLSDPAHPRNRELA